MKKFWLKSYPTLVPKVFKESTSTLLDFFEEVFTQYKDLPMIESMGKKLSYNEVKKLSDKFAAYIQNITNLKSGDRVAIQMPNILQYPIVAIGCIKAGLVIVNINPLYTSYEMEKQLVDAKVKGIIILENFASKLDSIISKINIENIFITRFGDFLGSFRGFFANFFIKYIKGIYSDHSIKKFISLKKIFIKKNLVYKKPLLSTSSIVSIQYTGGTTGILKGAILSHKNILANIEQMCHWIGYRVKKGEEVVMTALPLYHIFSFSLNFLTSMKIGARNILIPNPRDMNSFLKSIKNKKVSIITGVNTLFDSMMKNENFSKVDFSNLKITISGGMNLSKSISEKWKNLTGNDIVETYGLTEASPAAIGSPFDGTHRNGSIGLPIPGTDIKILDDKNLSVDIGTPGNLFIKGPQVMKGYWRNKEETKKVLVDGWLNTGDIAVMDADGFITIVDRKKELINISGFNVFPSEIENVISMHSGVEEVAVTGFHYSELRDDIFAFVVKKDEDLTERNVLNHCRKYLTNYKIPHKIIFVDALPKSPLGKVLKRLLEKPM